jgi:hypothetical protein
LLSTNQVNIEKSDTKRNMDISPIKLNGTHIKPCYQLTR